MAKPTFTVDVVKDVERLRKTIRHMAGTPVRILHDGVEYGVYQEFGTSRGVPAHPFMTPAVEAVRPAFERGWKQVIEEMAMSPDDFVEKAARDAEGHAKSRAPVDTGALKNSIAVSKPEEF